MKNTEEEILSSLMNNFPTYLEYVYSNIGLPNTTPLQGRLANIINTLPSRYILEAARGTGKSYIDNLGLLESLQILTYT